MARANRDLSERLRRAAGGRQEASPMPVSTAALESEPEPTTKPAVSKFTLNFQLEEAAALDEWVAAARRRVGRRVDKSQVVRALLAELYEDTTLETAIVKRLQRL